jgi:hypothetical protein
MGVNLAEPALVDIDFSGCTVVGFAEPPLAVVSRGLFMMTFDQPVPAILRGAGGRTITGNRLSVCMVAYTEQRHIPGRGHHQLSLQNRMAEFDSVSELFLPCNKESP